MNKKILQKMNLLKLTGYWKALLLFYTIFLTSKSNGSPSRIQTLQLHRMRRAVETSTEPVPIPESAPPTLTSSPPSTMTMPMSTMVPPMSSLSTMEPSMAGHDSYSMECDGDMEEVKKTCPDNSTCPLDEGNMEKCCRCLNICCGMTSSVATSSEESMIGSSTIKPGGNLGSKIKDAAASAEGWIKNAGENIKNSWNKAKDSISSAASDVSEKVKKGINSVANRVRNSTNQSECKTKDGKCTTEMPMGNGKATTGSSSDDDFTPVPGFQKSKRDLFGRNSMYSPYSYSQSSPGYDSRYSSSGYGNRDSSDSREYTWSKTTTTVGGSRDSNLANVRRYRRTVYNKISPYSTSTGSNPSPHGATGRARRASGSGMGFNEESRSSGGDCSSRNSNAYSSSGNSNSWSSGRNGRQERDSPNQGRNTDMNMNINNSGRSNGRSFQQSNSAGQMNEAQMRRTRRATPGDDATTENAGQINMTTIISSNKRNKREPKGGDNKNSGSSFGSTTEVPSNEDSEEDEEGSSPEGHYSRHGFNGNGNDKHGHRDKSDDSNYSISVKVLGPRGSNETKYSFSTGEQSSSDSNERNDDYDHRNDYGHSSHGHRGGGKEHYHVYSQSSSFNEHGSKNSNNDYQSSFDRPHSSQHLGSGGGVISGPHGNSRDFSNGGGRSLSFNHGHTMGHSQYGQGNYNHRDGGGGRQSHDFSNRGFIRSTKNDQGYYEPYEGSSSGIDVAYYPIEENNPDASLTAQTSYSNQHHYYDQNQNRHQPNSRYYNSGMGQQNGQNYMQHENSYGWNNYNNNNRGNSNGNYNYGNSNNNGMDGTYVTDNYSYNSQNSYRGQSNSNWGNMNPYSHSYDQLQSDSSGGGGGGSSSSSSSSSSSNSNDIAYGKPGKCKPLKSGVHCLPLQPDSSQCLFDNDCSGPKKCCFYGCKPNKGVGLCEYPVDGYVVSNNHGHHNDYDHDHNQGY